MRETCVGTVAAPATMTTSFPSAHTYGDPHESRSTSRLSSAPVSGSRTAKWVKPPESYPHTMRPSPRNAYELTPNAHAG